MELMSQHILRALAAVSCGAGSLAAPWCAAGTLAAQQPTSSAPPASQPAVGQVPREPRRVGGAAARAGDLDAIERRLYDASRRAPRDGATRAALGEWLASRGQLKSGAVLLEEARLFGGNAVAIATRLRHIYTWMRDWPSLAALPASQLSPGEKARVAALVNRPTSVVGTDSTVVPFAPVEVGALGRLPLVLGTDTAWAELDPQEEGIVLPGLARGTGLVDILGNDRRGVLGILQECTVGALTLHNVPIRIDTSLGAGRARIGFDVFAMLAPTVDGRAGTVTLRRAGRTAERSGATGLPFLLGFPGVRLAVRADEPPVPMTSPAGRAALRGRLWTVDVRRGVIWSDAPR
ncbi:MAG: hypothetical protein C0497_06715 [Gemmatimonas sp.]|nr:hypothetical protein [Gemmatimonas sp.]